MTETNTVEAVAANSAASLSEPRSTATANSSSSSTSKRKYMSFSFLLAHSFSFAISYVIIRSFWEFENASRALAFYGVYHRYGWNQVIHFFGVPGIIWSLLVFLVHVPLPVVGTTTTTITATATTTTTKTKNDHRYRSSPLNMNYAGFLAICYNLFYLSIDPLGAVLYAPVLYAMYASAATILQKDQAEAAEAAANKCNSSNDTTGIVASTSWYGTGNALKFAFVVHVLCWYVQIHLGHRIIEGAQPAVLQSLGGALSVAPLFAFYEGLWFLGINKDLQESTRLLVEEYTQELCAERGVDAMQACQSLLLLQE